MTNLSPAAAEARLRLLVAILFLSYLCVAMALPVVPVFVSHDLGFSNSLAGLGVGVAFLSTILSRGRAGLVADRLGAKVSVGRGLAFYLVGALVSLVAGWPGLAPQTAFGVLLAGRLLLGVGESLCAVGVIGWGIGLVGPQRSGKVLALVGAALYGALAVGGPVGLFLLGRLGFAGVMAVGAVLPALGLLAIWRVEGVAPHPATDRPSFAAVIGQIWWHGAIVCLQGIGFAALGAFFSLYFLARGWPFAGLGLTAFGLGFVLMRVLFGHLPDRIGGLRVAIASLAMETVGQAVLAAAPGPVLALAGAFLTGLGCSMIFPAMGREVVHRVAPHLRATAMGGFAAFQDLSYGLTGPIAGLLADRVGYQGVYAAGAVSAGLGFAIALLLQRRQALRGVGAA